MSTTFTTQADRIAQLGASAGEKLWLAIEDAYEAGMSGMANAFERALEQIPRLRGRFLWIAGQDGVQDGRVLADVAHPPVQLLVGKAD